MIYQTQKNHLACLNYWCPQGLQPVILSAESPECLKSTTAPLPRLQRSEKCNGSSLGILSSTDVLLRWFEMSVASQLSPNWPAVQTKLSLCASIMYVCLFARLGQHFGWLLGSWLKSFTASFLVCYYPDSLSNECSVVIWHIRTWSISMCVCLGVYFCSISPSLGQLLLRVSPSKIKSRKKPNEIKMLHSKFIIVVIGPHSGKYLSMCLSPIEIIKT